MLGKKAVIFDLDGVITDTAEFHYKAWKKLADELGIYFDEKINEQLKGVDRLSSLEIILKRSQKLYTRDEKDAMAYRKNEYYKELVEGMTPENILPGVEHVLKELKSRGIKTGLASASKNAFTVLDKLGIRAYFDYVVDASKIAKGKPDPEIFLTAACNLDVSPSDCIGVEDAEAGVKAIKGAKMYAVGIGDKDILAEADEVISGLDKFEIDRFFMSSNEN
ncbi:MAG: beta-phosphoglucomutase [Clostridia bacterium]|nr:beta-phosphoglucomutase [Clostridia bacterium]